MIVKDRKMAIKWRSACRLDKSQILLALAPKATVVRGNSVKVAVWAIYSTAGWDKIGIWKSAVTITPPRLVKI